MQPVRPCASQAALGPGEQLFAGGLDAADVVRQTGFGRLSHRERDGPGRFHLVATSAKNGNSRHLAIKKDLGLPSLIQRNLLFSAAVPVGFQKIAAHLGPMAPSTRKPTCV